MAALPQRLAAPYRTLEEVFRNPELRRLQLAWGGFYTGEWMHVVALAVFAYESGGATAVGVVGFVRMLPSAFAVPFAALLADRFPRERVLLLVHLGRAILIGAASLALFAEGAPALVYALAAFAAVSSTAFRPAQWALLPALARTPRELVAANVSSSTLEGTATFVGPLVGGIIVSTTSPGVAFAVSAAICGWSALLVARIGRLETEERRSREKSSGAMRRDAFAGFRTLAADREPRLLIGLFGAQTLVRGLLNVLIVVAALDLLAMGESGVGFLNSAFGAGALLGAFGALGLVGRQALAHPMGLGLLLWGAPIAAIGLWPEAAVALVALAIVGAGNSVLDVAGLTLVQRIVAGDVLGRVFGVLEMLAVGTVGLGAILAPLLISGLDERGALIATGALLPALTAFSWPRLRAVDAAAVLPERELELVRGVSLFAPLPSATAEQLARRLIPLAFGAGMEVIRQGDPGDRFYIVGDGELVVSIDGKEVRRLGPGECFGEIALLRDVPRTATVATATNVALYALERDVFVSAVSGHPQSAETAEAVISTRLGALRVPTTPL